MVPLKSPKAADLKPFLHWAVTKGNTMGHPLLFLSLPKVVQKADLRTIAKIHA
jgi:hypothetical protein